MNVDKPQNETPQQPKTPAMKIVGYNLLVVLGYGIPSVIPGDESGLKFYALMVVIHFLFCLCAAIYNRNRIWVLSAFLVIIVGLSVCSASGNLLLSKRFEG
jgi:multisubunit Na+/H+ antiporter MnhB subunit